MVVKLKRKSEEDEGKKIQIIIRVAEKKKEVLELLAANCEGISNIQDLISLAVDDLLKANTKLLSELKKNNLEENKTITEEEEIASMIEREEKNTLGK